MTLLSVKDRVVRGVLEFTGTQKILTAQLDITNACNLTCVHCYHPHHSNEGGLDFPAWREILDQYGNLARKLYLLPDFILCGGEPTISPLFWPILEELSSRWPASRISVLTNATRLNPEFAGRLSRLNVDFQISLDGPDSRRHDLIRGAGNFDQAMTGLGCLQDAGMNAAFLATLSHRNSFWIADFFETAARVRAERMSFTRFISQGSGRRLEERLEDRPLAPAELREAYRTILESSKRSGVATKTSTSLYHLLDPNLGAHGKSGFQGVVIDYQGNLKVSSRTNFKLGNVRVDGLENLFLRHPIMKALRDRDIEGCGSCSHYEHCGGDRNASFAATGSFLKKDPGCWLEENRA